MTRHEAACALIAHMDAMRLLGAVRRVANQADQRASAILAQRYDELTAAEREPATAVSIPRQARAGVLV